MGLVDGNFDCEFYAFIQNSLEISNYKTVLPYSYLILRDLNFATVKKCEIIKSCE
jgi:hypothetical protein